MLSDAAKNVLSWSIQMHKMKAIYHTLDYFNSGNTTGSVDGAAAVGQKCLIGECWCPVKHLTAIQQALHRGTVRHYSSQGGFARRDFPRDWLRSLSEVVFTL